MKKDARKRFTLRMPLELYYLIEVGADAAGTSANAFILQLLWKWAEQREKMPIT